MKHLTLALLMFYVTSMQACFAYVYFDDCAGYLDDERIPDSLGKPEYIILGGQHVLIEYRAL